MHALKDREEPTSRGARSATVVIAVVREEPEVDAIVVMTTVLDADVVMSIFVRSTSQRPCRSHSRDQGSQ